MGSRYISETFRRYTLRTTGQQLANFLQAMRDLDEVNRLAFIADSTKYERNHLKELESEAASPKTQSNSYAQKALPEARKRYEEATRIAEARCQMSATLTTSRGRVVRYTGTAVEIVEENIFSNYSSIDVRPSGSIYHPAITVKFSDFSGISVELVTGNMQLYDQASLIIPRELSRVSSRTHWTHFTWLPLLVWIFAGVITFAINGENATNPVGRAIEYTVLGVALVYSIYRYLLFPTLQISDEQNRRRIIRRKLSNVLGSLAIGIVGAFIFGWITGTLP
ncbi:hypothetical protein [Glutamicibacter sp. NPDC127525]|uniref:hypothetical protein n=1 Tax=unclassified Glutamicibacter TaxID=2627139 RepID=UPI00363840CD